MADLHAYIINPNHALARKTQGLRQLLALDPAAYTKRKRELPYFAGSTFRPLQRHKNNFVKADWFVIDLDHISKHDFNLIALKQRIWEAEPSLALMFTSPSGDGLKLVFRLATSCHDAAAFSAFYKGFLSAFANTHGVQALADAVTHDVSRVCFLAHDPEALIRLDATGIDLDLYLDNHQHDIFMPKPQQSRTAKPNTNTSVIDLFADTSVQTIEPKVEQILSADQLQAVIQTLNPKPPKASAPAPFVPEALDQPCAEFAQTIQQLGLTLMEMRDIQFGRKLVIGQGRNFAELNIFYGKRGFSVVISPKAGSNKELASQMSELANAVIYRSNLA